MRPDRRTLDLAVRIPAPCDFIRKFLHSHIRLIDQRQLFFFTGQFRMNLGSNIFKHPDKFFPLRNDAAPVIHQLLIPHGKLALKGRIEIQVMEKTVSLVEAFSILRQIRHINAVDLTQNPVNQPSSLGGTIFNDIQIFRREENDVHDSEKFSGPSDGNASDRNPLRFIFAKMHIDPIIAVVLIHMHTNMRFALTHSNHIPVSGTAMRFGSAGEINGLENVRLSLSICPVKYIDTGIQSQGELLIIPEIQKIERFNVQLLSPFRQTRLHLLYAASCRGGYPPHR